MGLPQLAYRAYERRLSASLDPASLPRHIGVIVDGNRRWARAVGAGTAVGHAAGADNMVRLLQWCDEVGVELVTLWLLSTDNLARPASELSALLRIIEDLTERIAATGHWHLHPVGALDLLPDPTARRLKELDERTRHAPGHSRTRTVNAAIGYGGRREIADAVRSLMKEHAARGTSIEELAEILDVDHIAEHLYTRGQPDPDLVIRTSGEQRLSGFLLWQSAHSEFYFCEGFWPDFRKVDFLRALRAYGQRARRFGG
ncbi:MAG: isoprenyl transferase [Angustibacter sp.]